LADEMGGFAEMGVGADEQSWGSGIEWAERVFKKWG
jgi:hypothetical protein